MGSHVNIAAIPQALREVPHWLAWTLVQRPGRPKPSKIPISPITGKWASPVNPRQWSTFDRAVEVYEIEHLHGIGYAFNREDPFTGIDLDGAIDPAGTVEPWAKEIITALDSYCELTPSRTGYHIIVKGALPVAGQRKDWLAPDGRKQGIEAYSAWHFLTMTGWRINSAPATVEERSGELLAFYEQQWGVKKKRVVEARPSNTPTESPARSDAEILDDAWYARNGERFEALYYKGDLIAYGGDHSRADAGLIGILAYYTQDPVQLDRLFRASKLMRDKWTEPRGASTYGENVIDYVLKNRTGKTWQPWQDR